jgi:hypothetical protein
MKRLAERPVPIFFVCAVALGAAVLFSESSARLPGNDQGYAPIQPIAFSHRLHAGELQIDCLYCHGGAERSAQAGIPPTSVCMTCHASVTARKDAVDAEQIAATAEGRPARRVVSAEIGKIYRSLGLDDAQNPVPGAESRPLSWVRVHDLPDFVAFDHRAHVSRGVACQSCHGPVESMERVRQFSTLSMGWCVECHRINTKDGKGALEPGLGHRRTAEHVSTDCGACHF